MMRAFILIRPLLAPAGGLLLFVAGRVLAGAFPAPWLEALGALLILAALAWSFLGPRFVRGGLAAYPSGRWLALPHALFAAAAALYFVGRLLADTGPGAVDWYALARWGWVLFLLQGAVLYVFVETAWFAQRHNPRPHPDRLRLAASAGNALGLALLLAVSLNFVFDRLSWEWNVAFFKLTRPSEATQEVAAGLETPVEVAVFQRSDSGVTPLLESYFRRLSPGGKEDPRLSVQFADADLRPELADAFEASGNGWVALKKEETRAKIFVGDSLEKARGQLRKFDESFFTRLLEVSRPRMPVYLTVGHGERNERSTGRQNIEGRFNSFRSLLRGRNFDVRVLGVEQAPGGKIPDDAAVVIVAGPTEPFAPGELEALKNYLEGGGRLLVFLEPGKTAGPLAELLESYGVRFLPAVQVNDRYYGRRTYTLADHALLVTIRYQNHESVRTLRRASNQFPLLFMGAGALAKGKPPAGLAVLETVLGMPGTWGDSNGDFRFDPSAEKRADPVLGLAVQPVAGRSRQRKLGDAPSAAKDGPRILAFADADVASDLLLRNRANRLAMVEAMAWLAGPQKSASLPASEEDVRIRHAKGDDWLWFYLPVVGIPAAVLLLGLWRVRRLRSGGGGSDEE